MSLSILIPVYNEEEAIEKTINSIFEVVQKSVIEESEIIVINDGSEDNTLDVLKKMDIKCKIINHKINKGYGASLKTGLRLAKNNNILITDADGTYPISAIPHLYEYYLENNLDMIIGARTGKNVSYPFLKKIPKFFIVKLANYVSGSKIIDINSGMRIFKRDIALIFYNLYPDGFSFTSTITTAMHCKGYEVEYMPIDYYKRKGKSKISPIKDTVGFFSLLSKIAMFFKPMKFFFPFVIILTVISMSFIIRDVFINKNLTQSSVLFPILTVLVFFIGLIADMISKK